MSHYFKFLAENIRFDQDLSKKALNVNIENYPLVSSQLRSKKDNILKYAVTSYRMYAPFLSNSSFKDRDFVKKQHASFSKKIYP